MLVHGPISIEGGLGFFSEDTADVAVCLGVRGD